VSGPAIALVVCAAVLHAIWNALAKRADNQFVFLWSSVSLATLLLLPFGLVRFPFEGTAAAGLPFVAASVAIHALYFYALGRSYRHGDFSRVYPMARGLGVALVPVIALPVFGERLSWLGALGVGLVVLGIAALSVIPSAVPASAATGIGAGTVWALVTGLTIAAYSLVDKAGVARLHPMPYIALMGLGLSVLLAPVVLADRSALAHEWRRHWRTILVASAMNLTSYPRALRLPPLESRLRGGVARAVDPVLGVHRESLAPRGAARAPARRGFSRARRCGLHRAGA